MRRSIPWVTWKALTGVEGEKPVEGYYHTHWLMGPWSTQAKAIVLKAAGQGVVNSSVVNDPLGEPGHTPLHLDLLSAWGSANSDNIFSPGFTEQLLNWEI